MKMHANARLSLKGRELLVARVQEAGWSLIACGALGIRHLRTRPYRPQTTRTLLAGWAYGAIYRDSSERNAALAGRLDFYNRRRPPGALSHKPPLARLNELNNLLGSYT
jgi:hypothetical protein